MKKMRKTLLATSFIESNSRPQEGAYSSNARELTACLKSDGHREGRCQSQRGKARRVYGMPKERDT